jgi:signal peptidase I
MGLTRRSRLRRALSVLSWVIALAAAIGWVAYLRPAGIGGSTGYVIVSGKSMEPMMHTGDLAIIRAKDDYRIGDVVAYRIPEGDVGGGMLVIHRVIGGSIDEGLVLQGDNRDTKDLWRPTADDVVGALEWHLPHVGTGLFLLRTPMVLAGILGFLGFWFVATSGSEEKSSGKAEEIVTPEVPIAPAPPALTAPAVPRPVEVVLPDVPARPASDAVTVAVTAGALALSMAVHHRHRNRH